MARKLKLGLKVDSFTAIACPVPYIYGTDTGREFVTDNMQTAGDEEEFDHNADRYPRLSDALTSVLDALDDPDLVVDRVELTALANGECNCRWWEPRAEEYDFVHIPAR